MRDFNKRFKQRQEEFDKDWQQARKLFWVGLVINFALVAFIIWVIVMTMKYFGIV